MPTYRWRDGAYTGGVKAQDAGEELARISASNNHKMTAAVVVDESRPEEAVLHPAFEWNDAKAAEEFRRQQANRIIRAVIEKKERVDPETKVRIVESAPPYHNVPSESGTGPGYYVPREVLAKHEDEMARALKQARTYLVSAQRLVEDLERLARERGEESTVALLTVAIGGLNVSMEAIRKLNQAA